MSMVGVKNRPSRDGFDLSRKNLFSAKVSEILPVAVIECLPGDKHVIKQKWMTRTTPLNTAAYTRIREYYNWYFVPTNLLWNKFNDFVMNQKNNNLKADSISTASVLSDQHPYVSLSQIWDYVHTLSIQDKQNFFGYSRARLTCKLLEYLGYGDFYDALTVGNTDYPSDRENSIVNIFSLLAYQKIYQDHIRDSQWERAYAPACNINYMRGTSSSLNIPLQDVDQDVENMFDLRYSNWNKDYFMGVLPNSQYGDASIINNISTEVFSIGTNTPGQIPQVGDPVTVAYVGSDNRATLKAGSAGYLTERDVTRFGILQLRQAEAVQKMREIMQSHEQDYKSQVEARWNVKVSAALSDRCQWLGGYDASIDINEVVNQAFGSDRQSTTGLVLERNADIKGKGVGVGDGYIRCNTECHGYLICLYHAVPVLDFAITGVKKHNLKTLFTDYAQPELDRTGMVSIPLVELMNKDIPSKLLNRLLGYAPQYYEYKTAYDECHGAFNTNLASSDTLKSWVSPIDATYIKNYALAMVATGTNEFMSYYFLKIPPAVLDPIFAVEVDDTVGTDQLKVNSYFDIKSVRNLDYNGLPY